MTDAAIRTTAGPHDAAQADRRRPPVLLLGALTAIGPFSFDTYLPAMPHLAAELSLSTSGTQLTLTGFLVGMAFGQLMLGPVSDAKGRRRPLLIALAVFAIASFACAAAPNLVVLVVSRFVQGFAGSMGPVVARAVIRDVASGEESARLFSKLMVVMGIAPVIAPLVGAVLLHFGSWRLVFVFLVFLGVAQLASAQRLLPETLAAGNRAVHGPRETIEAWRLLWSDHLFRVSTLLGMLVMGWLIVFLADSSFALQSGFGLSAQQYGMLFAVMAGGIAVAGHINHRLLPRFGVVGMLRWGFALEAVSAFAMAGTGVSGQPSLPLVAASLFIANATFGIVMPNAMALGVARHAERAGTASGLSGMLQSLLSASMAPVVGVVAGTSLLGFCSSFAAMLSLAAALGLFSLRHVSL